MTSTFSYGLSRVLSLQLLRNKLLIKVVSSRACMREVEEIIIAKGRAEEGRARLQAKPGPWWRVFGGGKVGRGGGGGR